MKNESETTADQANERYKLFDETLSFYNELDVHLFQTLVHKLRKVTGKVWKHLMALKSVLQLRESFDIEMVLAEYYFAHGYLRHKHHQLFLKHFALGKNSATTLRMYSDTAEKAFNNFELMHAEIVMFIKEKQNIVIQMTLNGQKNPDLAQEWIDNTEEYEVSCKFFTRFHKASYSKELL